MQTKTLALTTTAILIILYAAWYLASPLFIYKVVDEPLPTPEQTKETSATLEIKEEVLQEATFQDADSSHKTSGKIKLINSDETKYLRFEDFKTTNGPDLYVYLSKDLEAKDFIELGELKGNIGNQNYELTSESSTEEYPYVLIWCKQFGVLFGSAKF